MRDYYLENPYDLKGQPKKTVGEYAESKGILVPRRFASYEEAIKSGLPVIIRGEHEQDYAGISNLVPSYDISFDYTAKKFEGIEDYESLKRKILDDEETRNPEVYCRLLGLDESKFEKEVSFSFWEAIPGVNRTVIADSSIKDRYHVMSYRNCPPHHLSNYLVFEKGKALKHLWLKLPEDMEKALPDLIDMYDEIRNLDRFDPNNCPSMEFQTGDDGKNYFLQYHRIRDLQESKFVLDREPEKDEIEAMFVRGATPSEGIDCKITLIYGWQTVYGAKKDFFKLPKSEDGSLDLHYQDVFTELMSRKRKVQAMVSKELGWSLVKMIVHHNPRSRLFKPEMSFFVDADFIRDEDYNGKYERSRKTGEDQFMHVHVVSDGRKCYLKKLK